MSLKEALEIVLILARRLGSEKVLSKGELKAIRMVSLHSMIL